MNRFIDLSPGDKFRTLEIETAHGLVHRQFVKRTAGIASDAADAAIRLKFHALTPVFLIENNSGILTQVND